MAPGARLCDQFRLLRFVALAVVVAVLVMGALGLGLRGSGCLIEP
jgi:hypothetical protein